MRENRTYGSEGGEASAFPTLFRQQGNDLLPTTRSRGQTPSRRRNRSRAEFALAPDSSDTDHPHQHPPKDLPQLPNQHPPQP